jgi:hypothetical protein
MNMSSCIDVAIVSSARFFISVHALTTQGKFIDVMEYVTEYKLSSTLDEIHWNFYEEDAIVKVRCGSVFFITV